MAKKTSKPASGDSTPRSKPTDKSSVGRITLPKKRSADSALSKLADGVGVVAKKRKSTSLPFNADYNTIQGLVESSTKKVLVDMQRDTTQQCMFVAANMLHLLTSNPMLTDNGFNLDDIKMKATNIFDSIDVGTGVSATHAIIMTKLINDHASTSGNLLTPPVFKALTASVDKLLYDRYRGIKSQVNKLRPTPVQTPTGVTKKSKTSYAEFREQLEWSLHGGSFKEQHELLQKLIVSLVLQDRCDPSPLIAFLYDEPFYSDLEGEEYNSAKAANDALIAKVNFAVLHPEIDYSLLYDKSVTLEDLQSSIPEENTINDSDE